MSQSGNVFLFACLEQMRAVRCTHIEDSLAIRTSLGASLQCFAMLRVFGSLGCLKRLSREIRGLLPERKAFALYYDM